MTSSIPTDVRDYMRTVKAKLNEVRRTTSWQSASDSA